MKKNRINQIRSDKEKEIDQMRNEVYLNEISSNLNSASSIPVLLTLARSTSAVVGI